MGKYVRYSEEEKEAANSVHISQILDREGESYRKWGREFQWKRHDSVIFSGSKWFRYSEGEGGRAIGFCMKFFGKSFPEAMEYLLEFCPWVVRENPPANGQGVTEKFGNSFAENVTENFDESKRKTSDRLTEKNDGVGEKNSDRPSEKNDGSVGKSSDNLSEKFGESGRRNSDGLPENVDGVDDNPSVSFQLPAANPTMKNVYRYLIKERFVDPAVVSFFARGGSIYEEKAWHGVVFVGKDYEGKARNAHVRGTQDYGLNVTESQNGKSGGQGLRKTRKFRMTVEGSDPRYGFGHVGPGNILYAFEAPIDLLSFVSMYPKDWKQNSYVALNGVSDGAILRFLEEHSNVTSVILCLDNDAAGEKACKRITEDLTEAGVADVRRLTSHWKDWNEDLVKLNCQEGGVAIWDQSLY